MFRFCFTFLNRRGGKLANNPTETLFFLPFFSFFFLGDILQDITFLPEVVLVPCDLHIFILIWLIR